MLIEIRQLFKWYYISLQLLHILPYNYYVPIQIRVRLYASDVTKKKLLNLALWRFGSLNLTFLLFAFVNTYIHNTVSFLFFWLCKYLISFKASLGSQFANLLARSESWQGHCYYVHKCIRSTSSKNRAGDRVRDKKKSCWRLFSSRPDGMSKAGYFFESARIKKESVIFV